MVGGEGDTFEILPHIKRGRKFNGKAGAFSTKTPLTP